VASVSTDAVEKSVWVTRRTMIPDDRKNSGRFLLLDNGAWAPEGDYLPEGDRLLMFKPEVYKAEWSAA
jgi:hypothetical protein